METFQNSKPSGSKPILALANRLDVPTVWCLMDDYKHLYLEDHEYLDRKMLVDIVESEDLVVCLDELGGLPWGLFYISDIDKNARHGVIHFLCEPKRLKDVIKHDLIGQFIDKAFVVYTIDKLKGRAISTQSTAQKLLASYRFFKVGTLLNEVVVQKKRANVVLFELQKHYWQKMRRDADGAGRFTTRRDEKRRTRDGTQDDGGRGRGPSLRGPANRAGLTSLDEGHGRHEPAEASTGGAASVVQRSASVDAGNALATA